MVEESRRLIVLAGLAGSGKTELLHRLASHGEAVVDLENLAAHRGSVFGGLGRPPQPSPEQFAKLVEAAWRAADPARVLWIEDEGPFIGSVGLPPQLLQQICTAPVVEVKAPLPERVTRLTEAYGSIPIGALIGALESAAPRLGAERTRDCVQALRVGRLREAVEIVLPYYDAAYRHRVRHYTRPIVAIFHSDRDSPIRLLDRSEAVPAESDGTHLWHERRPGNPHPLGEGAVEHT